MNIALSLALAVFISASQAAFAQDRPPEKQSFGPDTYRTGTFTGEGTTRARLDCEGSTSAGRLCTGFLRSEVDGTLLDATIALPPGSGPHPLVAILHGWGGSKDSLSEFADALLKDAHAVLRYSARGFGKSWGQVNLADLQVELADLRSMIGQVVDDGRLHVKADAVGVMGISHMAADSPGLHLCSPFSAARMALQSAYAPSCRSCRGLILRIHCCPTAFRTFRFGRLAPSS